MDESLRTPEQLQASESHHRRVVELIHEAIWIHSDGRVVFANPQAALMFGCKSADDLIGRTAVDLVHPDDRKRAIERSRILTAFGEAVPLTEMRFLSDDGRTITLEVQAVPFMHEGRRSVLAVGRDISERIRAGQALRESEARFRTLADTLPALLWMCDEHGKCIFVNSRWIEYTGRSFEDELGHGFAEGIHPDQRRMMADLERSMLVEHSPITTEYMLRSKDGTYRWFLDTAVPRHSADGSYLGHVGVLIDIDERRRLEEQLRQAQKMETVGQLTGGMAHDFNNLLTVIVGVLELAVERAGDELRPGLRLALQASERGVELIKRLLAFSRQQMLMPETLDLNFIAMGMESLLRRTLGEQIDIEFKLRPGLWPAHADRGQVESALLNLAVNARDAMPGGGKLTIETKHESLDATYAAHNAEVKPGDYVVLAVTDTGRGMSPKVLEHAMEPFFTTKGVGKGTGLGLSMIYGFAKQSGGI